MFDMTNTERSDSSKETSRGNTWKKSTEKEMIFKIVTKCHASWVDIKRYKKIIEHEVRALDDREDRLWAKFCWNVSGLDTLVANLKIWNMQTSTAYLLLMMTLGSNRIGQMLETIDQTLLSQPSYSDMKSSEAERMSWNFMLIWQLKSITSLV